MVCVVTRFRRGPPGFIRHVLTVLVFWSRVHAAGAPTFRCVLDSQIAPELAILHLCKACRSAAEKFSPGTASGSRHGKCREQFGEILLFLFPQEMKLESAQNFHGKFHTIFHQTLSSCKCPILCCLSLCRRLSLKHFKGPWTFAWICCPQLPCHPCKNRTLSTSSCNTRGQPPKMLLIILRGPGNPKGVTPLQRAVSYCMLRFVKNHQHGPCYRHKHMPWCAHSPHRFTISGASCRGAEGQSKENSGVLEKQPKGTLNTRKTIFWAVSAGFWLFFGGGPTCTFSGCFPGSFHALSSAPL